MAEDFSNYVVRLDLAEDPFDPDFVSDYFYHGAGRREVLDQLIHLGRFSDQPVLLKGEPGSGKTTLVDVVVTQLHTVMDCCRVMADEFSVPETIISTLSETLHLPVGAGASLIEFIAALRSTAIIDNEPEPILVVVEHAQALSVECLDLLLALQKQSDGVVHLFLIGNQQLAEQLSAAEAPCKQLFLEPLSEQDVEDYLSGLLHSVGFADEELLTARQRAELHDESQGNIGKIKQLAPDYLSADPEVSATSQSFSLPSTHVIAAMLIAAALVLGYILLAEEDEYDTLQQTVPEMVQRPIIRESVPLELKKAEEKSAPAELKAKGVSEPPAVSPAKAALVKKTLQRKEEVEEKIAAAPAVIAEKPKQKPEPAPEKKPGPEKAKPVKANKPAPTKSVATQAATPSPREQRLLSLPESSYMLQLLGARNEANARAMVKRYAGRLPISYFETRLKGKPWFVVLAGPYDNRAAASAGIQHLPAELRKMKPWIRKTADIQSDLRKVHDL